MGLAKLSPLAENLGQNVRGQTVLAKLSVAKLSGHPYLYALLCCLGPLSVNKSQEGSWDVTTASFAFCYTLIYQLRLLSPSFVDIYDKLHE